MGLYGDGICHDRRQHQFCGSAATGDGLCTTLQWLPGGGWNGGALKFMILPMVAPSLAYIASIARITRGSMIEVLHSNLFVPRGKSAITDAQNHLPPCVKTRAAAGFILYGASLCLHYYRLNGD